MGDPREGLTADGLIRTGAAADRIDRRYQPLLSAAKRQVLSATPAASLYIYGSVATGQADAPASDIDLLSVGLPAATASQLSAGLSADYADLCRGVEFAAAQPADFVGEHDEAYGNRVFLRHYCVHLAGPDTTPTESFVGDRRAARGFNGDIAEHAARWRTAHQNEDAAVLGRRIARKLLLAVAGLVSVHDNTWTTDRDRAVARWSQVHPELAVELAQQLAWVTPVETPTRDQVSAALDGIVDSVATQFRDQIGLWPGRDGDGQGVV